MLQAHIVGCSKGCEKKVLSEKSSVSVQDGCLQTLTYILLPTKQPPLSTICQFRGYISMLTIANIIYFYNSLALWALSGVRGSTLLYKRIVKNSTASKNLK